MRAAPTIRRCGPTDVDAISRIVNAAAEAYRGVIPPDCWHEPYMPMGELEAEIAAGVTFWGLEQSGALQGVMGIQPVRDVTLIRHAYVHPRCQRRGVGSRLLAHLRGIAASPVLIGTWADAAWAVDFYRKHGFRLVDDAEKQRLLRAYWKIPQRQVETSVVLVSG